MTAIVSQVSRTRVGKYEVLEKIGQGASATVYKGQDPETGQLVAVKVIPRHVVADPVLRMRFAKECQVARKLDHPHIVRVLDFGLDGAKPFLVMEYVDGQSLGDRLDREGRLAEAEGVRIIAEIGQALEWAHQRGLVHRDVKPDNILLMADGRAKLTDLGLVKNEDDDLNLTQAMESLGTPNFMAPEQFKDAREADALCDVYSLAGTLYMAVTGELPFRADSPNDLMAIYQKKVDHDLATPRQLVPELSDQLEKTVMRALRADRAERQGSVQEFIAALTEGLMANGRREHRGKERFECHRGAACHVVQRVSEQRWTGQVVNLSETGLCLQLNRRFERGALLTIAMKGSQYRWRSLVVSVIWVRQEGPDCWKLGCKLDQPLSEFDVQELR
jgi:serine/threonine protein kinase